MRRRWSILVLALGVIAGCAWRWQSEILGLAAGWYLQRVAAREATGGSLDQRRAVVARTHRMLLMPPPSDALVPELFAVVSQLARRSASGAVSLNWAAYIYSTYYQDMLRDRPAGTPPRADDAIEAEIERHVAFYAIQKRPDVPGMRVSDLLGDDGGYSLEEIEQAEREGRELPLR